MFEPFKLMGDDGASGSGAEPTARQRCAERHQQVCHPRAPGEPNPITKKELPKRPDIQWALENSTSKDVPDVQKILCNMKCHVSRMDIHT